MACLSRTTTKKEGRQLFRGRKGTPRENPGYAYGHPVLPLLLNYGVPNDRNTIHYAVKQIITAQFATMRQQSVSAATENETDMNGQSVSNGHLTVNGAQANDQPIAGENDHFAAQANGHGMGRKHSSETDTAYPMFSKTVIGQTDRCRVSSATYEAKPNAEVYFIS